MKIPYAIIIMDGYGLNPEHNGNAIYMDGSKNVTAYRKNYPSASSRAPISASFWASVPCVQFSVSRASEKFSLSFFISFLLIDNIIP